VLKVLKDELKNVEMLAMDLAARYCGRTDQLKGQRWCSSASVAVPRQAAVRAGDRYPRRAQKRALIVHPRAG
jgi:hypothetical protein